MNKITIKYEHPRNAKCLCGSGKKFKKCCLDKYALERPSSAVVALCKEGKYEEALLQCRADITRYTIWHKSHTEPAIKANLKPLFVLLEIDIKALSEMVDILFECYRKINSLNEFPAALELLRDNIHDKRWYRRIIYFQTLCALMPDWNVTAGKQEFKKIGLIDDVDDVEILQLYLDIYRDEPSFSQKIKIADKIIANTNKWIDIIHYQNFKAVQYFLINQIHETKEILSNAIKEARKNITDAVSGYEAHIVGNTLILLSTIENNKDLLGEAIELFQKALKDDSLNPSGIAEIYRYLGDAWRYKEEWEQAKYYYKKSLELSPYKVSQIFLAECYLCSEQLAKANEILKEIKTDKLDSASYSDYVFIYAMFAIALGEKENLNIAEQLLKKLEFQEPYFKQRQQDLLISILECKTKGTNKGLIKRAFSLIRSLNRYLMLQPNIMGIGLNVNNIVKDIDIANKRHKEITSNDPSAST